MDAANNDATIRHFSLEEGRAEGRAEGREEGRAEGRVEGAYQAKLDTARNLLALNMEIELISTATGLPLAEIEKLRD